MLNQTSFIVGLTLTLGLGSIIFALYLLNYNKTVEKISADDIIELITKWKTAVRKLGRMRLADAQKEYTAAVRTGYGLDGDEKIKDADFEAVRGTFEQNSFVAEIERHIVAKTKLAEELIKQLGKLR